MVHLVSPLLRLVINGVKINGFVSFPAGAAQYNWFIRLVIVLVSPDARRVKKSHDPGTGCSRPRRRR